MNEAIVSHDPAAPASEASEVIRCAALERRLRDSIPVVLLDVRPRASFEDDPQMIPGAVWRDPDRVAGWAAGLPQAREVVAYCRDGTGTSRAVAEQLRRLGHRARPLDGGLEAWKATGGALARQDQPGVAGLARRTAMLDAVAFAATRLIDRESWQPGIHELLNRLGEATEATRVSLFEAHSGPSGVLVESCRYDWAAPGWATISDDPRYHDIPLVDDATGTELDDWTKRRMRGEIVLATLRDVTGYTRQIFEEHGTLSFLSVPIHVSGRWWGWIGFDDCVIERAWTDLEIDVLRTAATLIGAAIERARADERLRESEERYALAARGANDGLWDWNVVTGRAYFSPRLHEILDLDDGALGTDPEALLGRLTLADGRPARDALRARMERGGRRFEFECRVPHPRLGERWVVARGLVVYEDEWPRRVVGSIHDTTTRKIAEARVVSSEARLRAILETASDAIITIDERGHIVEFNRAASEIFGYARDAALGRPLAELIVPPQLRAAHHAGFDRYLETGRARVLGRLLELQAMRADGTLLPVELAVNEVAAGDHKLFTAFIRDISERKRFERDLQDAETKRLSLARYFAPTMVEELMASGGRLDAARVQNVAVLFADIVGFSAMSASAPAVEIIGLLREYHALLEQAVFANDGTLDKYLGDGVMATFGTPKTGSSDATNAVACARAMLAAVEGWNEARAAEGKAPIRIGIGVHYGEAVLGDTGGPRRLEFAVLGDTVNVASRIEALTRELGRPLLVSAAVADAVEGEGASALLEGFEDLGPHVLRGRGGGVRLWGWSRAP